MVEGEGGQGVVQIQALESVSWGKTPILPLASYETLGGNGTSPNLSFLLCKMIIIPTQ